MKFSQFFGASFQFFATYLQRWRLALLFLGSAIAAAVAGVILSGAVNAQSPPMSAIASAGEATAYNRTSSAYEEAVPTLTPQGVIDHDLGDEAFEEAFVLTPGLKNSGLGPVFNNASCVSCHIRNGRGMPEPGQLLLRVSNPNSADVQDLSDAELYDNAPPVLGIGKQIQDFSVMGVQPEASVEIEWETSVGTYADGEKYEVRSPEFNITLANGDSLPESVRVSPRLPPHVYGLGLLEAIPEADLLALADVDDENGDGISGRPNYAWDLQKGEVALGRFGWKANSPNLLQQSADAYLNDMGIHSYLFPAEDGSVEVDEATLIAAAAYAQTLAVPARAAIADSQVQRGEKLFDDASCQICHVSSFKTGEHKYPSLENQLIHPYTDLLLHDMGEQLADNRPDFEADGQEWRTPSLWGIGLAQTVLPYSGYLHDGRARSFEEAILWHGGEAESSKAAFEKMPSADRAALVRFLQSL